MKITDNIYAIKHDFKIPITPVLTIDRFVYSFIILGEKEICLVDSGVYGSENPIFDCIERLGRSKQDVSTLILTHAHPDHIGAAARIKDITGCIVCAHELEKPWIEDIDLQYAQRPVPGFQSLVKQSVVIDRLFADKDSLILDNNGMELKFIDCPGHSKGSLSLFIEQENTLICADALILPGGFPIYEDYQQTIDTVNKLKKISAVSILLSSWADPEFGEKIYQTMDQSLDYLKLIHRTVRQIAQESDLKPMELCAKLVQKCNLPAGAVNPLVARSLQSNLKD